MAAGVFNIYAGLCLFVIGLICLVVFYLTERKRNNSSALKKTVISFAILVLNFPVATAALFGASYLLSMSTLMVENNSQFTISDLVLIERDTLHKFVPIDPKQNESNNFHFKYEGSVMYKFSLNNVVYEGVAFDYVTSNAGQKVSMKISKNGSVAVSKMKSNKAN